LMLPVAFVLSMVVIATMGPMVLRRLGPSYFLFRTPAGYYIPRELLRDFLWELLWVLLWGAVFILVHLVSGMLAAFLCVMVLELEQNSLQAKKKSCDIWEPYLLLLREHLSIVLSLVAGVSLLWAISEYVSRVWLAPARAPRTALVEIRAERT